MSASWIIARAMMILVVAFQLRNFSPKKILQFFLRACRYRFRAPEK